MFQGLASYNITYDFSSPMLIVRDTFQPCYTESGCADSYPGGDSGAFGVGVGYLNGNSANGTFATLYFYGNAVYVYGTAPSSTNYSIQLDSDTTPIDTGPSSYRVSVESPDLLFSSNFPASGNHQIWIRPGGPLNITSLVVSDSLRSSLPETTIPFWDTAITYTGNWTHEQVDGLTNGTMSTIEFNATASFQFSGEGVILYGSLPTGHMPYNVTLDGTTKYTDSVEEFYVSQSVIYAAGGLDPSQTHTLTLANTLRERILSLTTITVMGEIINNTLPSSAAPSTTPSSSAPSQGSSASSSSSSSPNIGAIAGGVVGGVVLICNLAIVLFCLLRRSRRNKLRPSAGPVTLAAEYPDTSVLQPYGGEKFGQSTVTMTTNTVPYGPMSVSVPASGSPPRHPGSTHYASSRDPASNPEIPSHARYGSSSGSMGTSTPSLALPTLNRPAPFLPKNTALPPVAQIVSEIPSPYTRPDPTPEDVDRIVELVAARIDRRGDEREEGLPDYVDRRRPEDRD